VSSESNFQPPKGLPVKNAKANPFLTALLALAIVGIVLGVLLSGSLQTATLGLAVFLIGGFALVGWLIAAAADWRATP
jgi:membrane protein CcdC involved in cytochrome C biogenesis